MKAVQVEPVSVEQVMSRSVVVCAPEDTLHRAASLLWEKDCGALPVLDEATRVVGMITDRDICMAAFTTGSSLPQLRVAACMSREPRTCGPDDSLEAVCQIMRLGRVRRLPVVDEEGRLVGIISQADLVRGAARASEPAPARQVLATLAAISHPRSTNEEPAA